MNLTESLRSALGVTHQDQVLNALLIHLNIFFYALSFWLQQPTLPFLSKSIGSDEVMWGYQQSLRSFFALLGGPVMGRVTDTKGPKISLILAQLGSAVQYFLVAWATSVHFLFLAAVPCALQHAMLCSQAAVSVLSSEGDRSKALARLSLSYGVGMVVGSYFGGVLSKEFGEQNLAFFAGVISLFVIAMDFICLPPLHPPAKSGEKKNDDNDNDDNVSPLKPAFILLQNPSIRSIILFSTVLSLGVSAYRAMNALILEELYSFDSSQLGQLMSFSAVIALFTNVFLVGKLNSLLGDFSLCFLSSACLSITYLSFSVSWDFYLFLLFLIPNTVASAILYTVSSSILSKLVEKKDLGTSLSLSHASRSLTGMISPVVGGYIFQSYQAAGLSYFAVGTALVGSLFLFCCKGVKEELRVIEEKEKKRK